MGFSLYNLNILSSKSNFYLLLDQNSTILLCSGDIEEDDMMIPSELSSLPANQNGGHHGGGHFGEAMFQHAEQLVRSQLLGQLGQDQMQLLHSLQQLGRKQKEVSATSHSYKVKNVELFCKSGVADPDSLRSSPSFLPDPDSYLLVPKQSHFSLNPLILP
jgi:hypothetical protein